MWFFRQPEELPSNWDESHACCLAFCVIAISSPGPALTKSCSLVRSGPPGTQRRRSTRWSGRRWPSYRRLCPRRSGKRTIWSPRSAPRWSARWQRPSGRRRRMLSLSSTSRKIRARWGADGRLPGEMLPLMRAGLFDFRRSQVKADIGVETNESFGGGNWSRLGTCGVDQELIKFCFY